MPSSNPIDTLKSEWLNIAGALLGALAAVASLFFMKTTDHPVVSNLPAYSDEIPKIGQRLEDMTNQVNDLRSQLSSLSQVSDQTKLSIQIQEVNSTLKDMQSRQTKLEEVILNNPSKAIEVPLLRKDLDSLKDAQQQGLLVLRQGVDQVYDLNKWLLGAMAVSVVTLALSNLLKGREKERPSG